jgi:hypothetical protein
MFLSNCNQFTRLAAASAFMALTAVSAPASPDELAEYLDRSGPHEAILTTVGDQRVIAFYEPGNDHCSVHAVVWANTKTDAVSAARVRIGRVLIKPCGKCHSTIPRSTTFSSGSDRREQTKCRGEMVMLKITYIEHN